LVQRRASFGRLGLGAVVVTGATLATMSMVLMGSRQDLAYISAPSPVSGVQPPNSARLPQSTTSVTPIPQNPRSAFPATPEAATRTEQPHSQGSAAPETEATDRQSASSTPLGLATIIPPASGETNPARPLPIAGESDGDLWFKDLKLADVDTRYGLLRALAGREREEKIACSPSLQKMGTAALDRLDAVNCAGEDLRIAVGLVRGQMTSLTIEDSAGAELMAIHGPKGLNVRLAGLGSP
jgi:hypothetical protein